MPQQTISTIETIVTTKTETKVTRTEVLLALETKRTSVWKMIKLDNLAKLIPWIKMIFDFNKT